MTVNAMEKPTNIAQRAAWQRLANLIFDLLQGLRAQPGCSSL